MINTILDKRVRNYFARMTESDFISMLSKNEYKPKRMAVKNYMTDKNIEEMNKRNYVLEDFTEVCAFNIDMTGALPTPDQYAKYKFNNIVDKLKKDGVNITDEVKGALYNRRVNGYVSYMNEEHTKCILKTLLPQEYEIMTDSETDQYKGVDIIIINKETNKQYYIHITSNTTSAIKYAKEKETRGQNRDFSGHIWLCYDKLEWDKNINNYKEFNSRTTTIMNGYYLFNVTFLCELAKDIIQGDVSEWGLNKYIG